MKSQDKFEPKDQTKVRLEYFSTARNLMMLAATKHPVLVNQCAQFNQRTQWPEIIAEIAAYCNVVLDGSYLPMELENLYCILADKLDAMPVLIGAPSFPDDWDGDFSAYEHKLIGGK